VSQRAEALLGQPLLDVGDVDLGCASRLTYVLRQTFRYEYDRPVYQLRQRLVVVPVSAHGSARRRIHRLTVTAKNALIVKRRQRNGNLVVVADVSVVGRSVGFTLEAVVERDGPHRDHLMPASAATARRWLMPTTLTAADDAVLAMAQQLRGKRPRDVAEESCTLARAALAYEFGVTSTRTTAAEAVRLGRGVCQDHAHLMIALCRTAGVAARYVSGHLLGEGGTHAWVEVLVAENGVTRAVAFDPCNGCPIDERYLTVATGRDYSDVAPTSGTYFGPARGRLAATKQMGLTAIA
jgi:transglutaminase-like putative cysteine protease